MSYSNPKSFQTFTKIQGDRQDSIIVLIQENEMPPGNPFKG